MATKPDVFDPKWDDLAFDEPRRAVLARMRERKDTFASVAKAAGLNATYLLQYFKKPAPRLLPLPVARRLAEALGLPVERLYVEGPIPNVATLTVDTALHASTDGSSYDPDVYRAALATFFERNKATLRSFRGWCERAGFDEGALRKFINGQSDSLSMQVYHGLAAAAGVPLIALLPGGASVSASAPDFRQAGRLPAGPDLPAVAAGQFPDGMRIEIRSNRDVSSLMRRRIDVLVAEDVQEAQQGSAGA